MTVSSFRGISSFARAFLLVAVVAAPAAAQDDLQNPNYLKKVVRNLAAENRASQIYAFLENEFPEFSSILKKAELARFLDGALGLSEFERIWRVQKALYETEGGKLAAARSAELFLAFKAAMGSRPVSPPPVEWTVAEMLAHTNRVKWVRGLMYQAENHPLRAWSQFKTVTMAEVPGKLLWFNPDLAIPELGIKPGVALTAEQRAAVVKLFSVRVATEVPGQAKVGKGSYPADVGRAINPVTKALTIIDGNNGSILGELTLKGTGKNPTTDTQRIWNSGSPIGHLETDEGLTDSQVALKLRRALVDAYAPVAVIDVSEIPGKGMTGVGRCVYVRASESLVRWSPHLDEAPGQVQEKADMKLLLEYTAREVGLNEAGRPYTVKEWAEEYLPRRHGRNAGTLAELGFGHTNHSGNVGPGFIMDFGEAELFNRSGSNSSYVRWFEESLTNMVKQMNQVQEPSKQISLQKVKAAFTAAVAEGRAFVRATKPEITISSRYVPRIEAEEMDHLLTGYREWIQTLQSKARAWVQFQNGKGGWVGSTTAKDIDANRETLEFELNRWQIQVPAGQKATNTWMGGRILEKYDALDGTDAGKRKILRIIGGVEDAKPIELLTALPLEALRQQARKAGVEKPEALNRALLIQRILKSPAPPAGGQANRSEGSGAVARVRHEGYEAGKFAAAYLIKEGVNALETRDPRRMEDAARTMATAEFWTSLGAFTAASRVAERGLAMKAVAPHFAGRGRSLVRGAIPLTAGMAAIELMSGRPTAEGLALGTGSFFGAGLLVNGGVDRAVHAALKGTVPGRYASAALGLGKLVGTLYFAEKIDAAVRERVLPQDAEAVR